MREFFTITDYRGEARRRGKGEWDGDRLADFQRHLRSLGVAV